MSQQTILERFHHLLGLHVWVIGISVFVAALVVIGCGARSPRTAGADVSSGVAESANSESGLFKRIGLPVGGKGYIAPIFSGNSRRFIALNERAANETVRVWDVLTLQPLCDPLPENGPAWGLTFDGKIAFTTDFQNVRFWNVDASKLICVTKVTDGKLHDVAISPDGRQFLTFAEGEQAVEVWRTGETRPRLLIKQDAVDAAFDPTSTRVAIFTGSFHIYSAETGKETCPPISYRSNILPELPELFDSTGRWLIVYEYDGFLVVDVATGKTRFEVPLDRPWTGSSEDPKFVRWSADSSKIVAAHGFDPHPASIYDAVTGKLERTVGADVWDCWAGPGSHWAMGFRGASKETFDVWDVKSGRRVQTLKLNDPLVSPDCSTIMEEREDGLGAVWRTQQR